MSCDDWHVGRTDGAGDEHDAEAWRDVGAFMTRSRVDDVQWQVQEALHDVITHLEAGEPLTAAEIDTVRRAMDELQNLTEEHLARIATDTEPWDRGAGMSVPYGVMRRHLEDDDYPPDLGYRTGDTLTDEADEDADSGASEGGETHE